MVFLLLKESQVVEKDLVGPPRGVSRKRFSSAKPANVERSDGWGSITVVDIEAKIWKVRHSKLLFLASP
jgi:hypothetical protein